MSRKPPARYAPYGMWAAQATRVKLMVENENWGVSDAVRQIVAKHRYPDRAKAFNGIRAAYYELRKKLEREGEFEI